MAAMPKRRTALSHTTGDAKRKKASRREEDSAQQEQAILNFVLAPIQGATCTNVGVAIVNNPAILPGQQLQIATVGMPESPPE